MVESNSKRFIISGCGRSGTTYMSQLLTDLGCSCTHEKIFPKVKKFGILFYSKNISGRFSFGRIPWKMPPYGESAWEAVPFLKYLPKGTVIFHLVRHPIRYIRSRQKKGCVYKPFRDKYCPITIDNPQNLPFENLSLEKQVNYYAEFWMKWNLNVELYENSKKYNYLRLRLEDIDSQAIAKMFDLVNFKYNYKNIEHHFNQTPKDIHSRGETNNRIAIDLIDIELRSKLVLLAEKYGYDMESEI